MTTPVVATAVIFGFMLAEARVSARHEAGLRAAGAVAPAGDRYRLMAMAYPLAFILMGVEGAWRSTSASLSAVGEPSWLPSGIVLFTAAKALKYWAIVTLGERWTFKVLVLPGRPLIGTGPYRYVSHPNYIGVLGELAGAAMMDRATVSGPLALAGFSLLLWRRVRLEERAHRSIASSTRG